MRHALRPLAAALCLAAACCANAQQASPANLERVEVAGRKAEASKWFRAESQHFTVYSDTREEDVTPLLGNLEKLDHLLRIYTQPIYAALPLNAGAHIGYIQVGSVPEEALEMVAQKVAGWPGQTIRLVGPVTVGGGGETVMVWQAWTELLANERQFTIIGRLAPGVSIELGFPWRATSSQLRQRRPH